MSPDVERDLQAVHEDEARRSLHLFLFVGQQRQQHLPVALPRLHLIVRHAHLFLWHKRENTSLETTAYGNQLGKSVI